MIRGHAKITNLDWEIDEKELSKSLGISNVRLLNDLQATAYHIPFLKQSEQDIINEGEESKEGTIAVIAPGTGLGEAFLVQHGERYDAYASEGGHCDYAETDVNSGLFEFLHKKWEHVSYERVCSGPGIYNIFQYFLDMDPKGCPMAEEISKAEDPAPLITDAALSGDCNLCKKTVDTFVSILGAEASNLSLKVLAMGGLYIGGGIAPKTIAALKEGRFMESFLNKGRMSKVLSKIPVKVILNARAPLLGAARYGLDNTTDSDSRGMLIHERVRRN